MQIGVDIWFTLALAATALVLGRAIVDRVHFLSHYSIPDAVVGGLLFSAIILLLRGGGNVQVSFDSALLTPLNVMFFTTVGLSADARSLAKGGKLLIVFLAVVVGSLIMQNAIGVGLARRMSLTGDYLSADDALRAGLVTEVVPHDRLMEAARRVAASIVGNNQRAVRALLASYHRIDESQTNGQLWMEAEAARRWMASTTGDDIAASRASVIERGRAQVR